QMISMTYTRWFIGAALGLAMGANLAGVGSASAQTLDANLSPVSSTASAQLASDGSADVVAGTTLTVHGSAFAADESVGLWINVPAGAAIPPVSLGQDNTSVDGAVVPLNAMGWADSDGNLNYSLDTTGLPSGSYSLVAHGLNSDQEELLMFTIK